MLVDTVIPLSVQHGSLLNCLGIQPVFVDKNTIEKAFYGFVYRVANFMNKGGRMHYLMRYTKNENNNDILQNAFHIKNADRNVINKICQNSFTLKHNTSLDVLMENDDLLKETLMFYLKRIQYYISIGSGNFIITSRKDLYNKKLFTAQQIANFEIYLVAEQLLPKNILLLGHKNQCVFCNPLVASPLIDKTHFEKLCQLNDINFEAIPFNKELKTPMIDRYLNYYSIFQSYLDNVEVPYWFIETFKNPTLTRQKAYYTTLFFD